MNDLNGTCGKRLLLNEVLNVIERALFMENTTFLAILSIFMDIYRPQNGTLVVLNYSSILRPVNIHKNGQNS